MWDFICIHKISVMIYEDSDTTDLVAFPSEKRHFHQSKATDTLLDSRYTA